MPPTYARMAMAHISATGDPISSCLVLGYRVFGDGGSNGAIYGSNKSKMAVAAILEKFRTAISPQPVVRSTILRLETMFKVIKFLHHKFWHPCYVLHLCGGHTVRIFLTRHADTLRQALTIRVSSRRGTARRLRKHRTCCRWSCYINLWVIASGKNQLVAW